MFETIIFGIVLFMIYVVNGSILVPMVGVPIIAFIFGITALIMLLKGKVPRAKDLGIKTAVLVLVGVFIMGFDFLDDKTAKNKAEDIAMVCESYKAKTGAYPESFKELIPAYLKSVPAAKFTIMWRHYRIEDSKIMFVREPGMLASAYDLATKKWKVVNVQKMFPIKAK